MVKIPRSNHLATNFLIQRVRFQTSSWIQDLYPLHAVPSLSGYLGCQSWGGSSSMLQTMWYSRISHFHYSASTPACSPLSTLPFPKSHELVHLPPWPDTSILSREVWNAAAVESCSIILGNVWPTAWPPARQAPGAWGVTMRHFWWQVWAENSWTCGRIRSMCLLTCKVIELGVWSTGQGLF